MLQRNIFEFDPDDGTGAGTGDDGSTDDDGQEGGQEGQQEDTSGTVPRSELAKANAEAKKFRHKLRETEAKVKDLEDASKTELERERERATTLEAQVKEANAKVRGLRASVLSLQAGVSPEAAGDAAALLDWDSVEDPDDEGQVLDALKDLVKAKPYLKGGVTSGADGGKGNSAGDGPADMNAAIRQAAGR